LDEVMNYVKGPDFPTGGIIMGIDGIRSAFETGKGKIVVRSRATIEKAKTCQQIVVTEIPYETVKVNIVKRIDEIRFNKDIDGILDVRDESGRNGLRIVIDVNKNSDAQLILNYLYKNTELQVNYNYNMIAIVDRRPRLLGLLEAIDAFIEFRKEVVLRRSKYEFARRIDRCHILEGLIKAVSVLDEVIKIIRNSKDKGDAKRNLIARFEFSDAQAEAIVNLRLYRLTNTDIVELRSEYAKLVEELKVLRDIINDPKVLARTICTELETVRSAYKRDRRSEIIHEVEEIVIDKSAMITAEDIMISVSRDAYIKRVSLRSYNSSQATLPGIKSGDSLIGYAQASTLESMLLFFESGEYAYLPLHILKEDKWKDIGTHLSNYVKINNSEKIVDAALVSQFHTNAYVISLSDKGMVKKTPVESWQMQRYGRSSTAMILGKDEKVVRTRIGYDDDEIVIVTKDGYSVRYPIDQIPSTAAKAKGVIGIRCAGEDKAADMALIRKGDTDSVFLTEAGNGKRIKLSDLQRTNRATKGLLIAKKNKTNPAVIRYAYSAALNDSLDLALETELADIRCKDISLLSADSRFSNPVIQGTWNRIEQIQIVKVVDFPPKEEKETGFEEFTLEV
ncbi:MAG: DNA gyrase subunit A, partial [Erysipelotrichaceae bacterium]|nr:DNA gyrase subunit A [Erysipelotrichaceae bacterium]